MPGEAFVPSAIVVVIAACVAAFTDVSRFRVHNLLTFPLALSGVIYFAISAGWQGVAHSMGGLALGLGMLIVPYLFGALGAGDVKFFAAVGAWLGVDPMFVILIVACLATGVYSLYILLRRGGVLYVWLNLQLAFIQVLSFGKQMCRSDEYESVQGVLAKSPDYRSRLVPFSAMLGVGILVTLILRAVQLF